MKTIKLSKAGYWGDKFEIEVKDLNGTEINIYSASSKHGGTGKHYDITISTEENKYHIGDVGVIEGGLANFFIEQLYKQNIIASIIEEKKNNGTEIYKISLKKFDPVLAKLKKKLELLESSKSELRFAKINEILPEFIKVEYYGHEVGGSYVYDYEVVPTYIKTLEYESNRKVEWIKRRSGGFGNDIYKFKVFLNRIIDQSREDELIIGKRYHIDTTGCCSTRQSPYAFRVSPGVEWAMMYSISENFNKNITIPNVIIKKDKIVNIYGIDVFKIIVDAWEKNDSRPNSGRTHFKGTFDLIIEPYKFRKLYLDLYGELNNCIARIYNNKITRDKIVTCKIGEDKMHGLIEVEYLQEDGIYDFEEIGYLPVPVKVPEKKNNYTKRKTF